MMNNKRMKGYPKSEKAVITAVLTVILFTFCVICSMAASVSAETMRNEEKTNTKEMCVLARVLDGIYKGRDHTVRTAIAGIIIQRVKSPLFPDSVAGVILSDPVFKGALLYDSASEPTKDSLTAVSDAMEGMSPCPEALFFYENTVAIGWKSVVLYQSDGYLFV